MGRNGNNGIKPRHGTLVPLGALLASYMWDASSTTKLKLEAVVAHGLMVIVVSITKISVKSSSTN